MHAASPAMSTQTDPERLVDTGASSDERTYATFMHLSLLGDLLTGGIGLIVLLVMWLMKKNTSPFLDDHGREALNFRISLLVYTLASLALFACGIGVITMLAVPVLGIVGMVMAVSATNRGEYFRYPATIRFIH